MRIQPTITVPTNRPVRQQPAAVQPHFGPGVEMVGLSNPGLTARPAEKPAKKGPKATEPAPPKKFVTGFFQEYRGIGPNGRPLFVSGPIYGDAPVTPNPNAPKAPLQLAPSAPGATPPPNFGRPMPAAWKVAATTVLEG